MPWLCVEMSVQWPLEAPSVLSLLVRFVPLSSRNVQCLEIRLRSGTAGGHLYSTLFLHWGAATCLIGEGCQSNIAAADRFKLIIIKSRVDYLLQEEEIEAVEGGSWEHHKFSWLV